MNLKTTVEPVAAAPRPRAGLRASLEELWRYRELLRHLVGRQLKVKYKRSLLGWTWSLVNPLLVAGVFTLIFSVFLRIDPPVGNPSGIEIYVLFFLAGLLSWNFLSNTLSGAVGSITAGGDLIRKVYFPRAVLSLTHSISTLVWFLIELGVLLVLVVAFGVRPWLALTALPLLMAIQFVFVTGLGLLVAALNVFFRDLQHLLGIVLMVWFYGTPIIYPPSRIEEAAFEVAGIPIEQLFALNPMWHFVAAYRDIFYHGRFPSFATLAILAVVSLVVGWLCFNAFRRLEPRFAEEI